MRLTPFLIKFSAGIGFVESIISTKTLDINPVKTITIDKTPALTPKPINLINNKAIISSGIVLHISRFNLKKILEYDSILFFFLYITELDNVLERAIPKGRDIIVDINKLTVAIEIVIHAFFNSSTIKFLEVSIGKNNERNTTKSFSFISSDSYVN